MAEKGTKKRATTPKAKVTKPRAVKVEPEVKAEVYKCKSCGSELKKILFDSKATEPVYLYVCDVRNCPLYRQPQEYDGPKSERIHFILA